MIVEDFKGAWDSVAINDSDIGRGNFMFARQAMSLLEFAFILCEGDSTREALRSFSIELEKIESHYFTELPGPCTLTREFTLPHNGNDTGNLLLWAMFDLIRHGLAHQYQQTMATLADGKHIYFLLTGAEKGRLLANVHRSSEYLSFSIDDEGDLRLAVQPDILFLDIESAVIGSKILEKGLTFSYLTRPRMHKWKKVKMPKFYDFKLSCLEKSLLDGGHIRSIS